MNPDSNTIQLQHPDPAKTNKKISLEKYEVMKAAILHFLNGQSLTHTQLCDATTAHFATIKLPFEGNLLWYMESTKLDLEAGGLIKRVGKSPQKYLLAGLL